MKLYLALNEPGSGEISIHASDPAAPSIGKFVQLAYRGEVRGGFFIESIANAEVAGGEKAEQWRALSGRGLMAILEETIVWEGVTDGEVGSTTRRSDGRSMAQIMLILIEEAKARGALTFMDTDFTATVDSTGQAWTDFESHEGRVGMSMLDVMRQFAEMGIDFDIVPMLDGRFLLRMYKNGLGKDKSATVVLRVGQNCTTLSDQQNGSEIRNALLVEYTGGFASVQDNTSIGQYRRREGLFQVYNAPTYSAGVAMVMSELGRLKNPDRAISVKVYDANGPRVFVDYGLGDWISLAREDGSVERWRIRGLQLEWQDNWYADVVVELNSVKMETELRVARQIRKLSGASMGSALSTPPEPQQVAKQGLEAHNVDPAVHDGNIGNALKIQGRNVSSMAPSDKNILAWDAANAHFKPMPIGDFTHNHSAADLTSGTLDGDRLTAMSTTKKGAVPATGTPTGKFLRDDATFAVPAAGALPTSVTRETPAGTKNGSNATFTLAHTPIVGSEMVYMNGLLLNHGVGNDYTISGATITMLIIPISTDILLANYKY
jgi:hypothetical protein